MKEAAQQTLPDRKPPQDAASGAFFWLSAFYFVYCARPEDWIPGLAYLPLAKITGTATLVALLMSAGQTPRKFKDLPREAFYLLAMIGILFVSAIFSPVWKSGAFFRTLDFFKAYIAWVLTFLLVTTFSRLRRIIFIQAACLPLICLVSIVKGHSLPRLEGVLGGIYGNANDLAFAIVLSLPLCLTFLLTAKSVLRKCIWAASMLTMLVALFMTASRAGFIDLVISGTVCLWHFGVKGRRFYLIVTAVLGVALLMAVAGGPLKDRFEALSGEDRNSAYSSYEARRFLMLKALEGIEHYPVLGIGAHDFIAYSTIWHQVHMTYLQIAVEGGIPSLILFLLFFRSGFANLKRLRRTPNLPPETVLFVGGLHSSLVGFAVGALFAPEAYQFFPYLAVAFTSALVAMIKEQEVAVVPAVQAPEETNFEKVYVIDRTPGTFAPVR